MNRLKRQFCPEFTVQIRDVIMTLSSTVFVVVTFPLFSNTLSAELETGIKRIVPETAMLRKIYTEWMGSYVMDFDLNEVWAEPGPKIESITWVRKGAIRHDYTGWVSYRATPQQEVKIGVSLLFRDDGRWLLIPTANAALKLPNRNDEWIQERVSHYFGKSVRKIVVDAPQLLLGEVLHSIHKQFAEGGGLLPKVPNSTWEYTSELINEGDRFFVTTAKQSNPADEILYSEETNYYSEVDVAVFNLPGKVRVYEMVDIKFFKEDIARWCANAKGVERRAISTDNLPKMFKVSPQKRDVLLALPVPQRRAICQNMINRAPHIEELSSEQKYDNLVNFPDVWEEEIPLVVQNDGDRLFIKVRTIYDE